MNLSKKKKLAMKTLKVGKERIIFLTPRLDEIKEAITKADIRDLHKSGAILIREIKGRRKTARKKKGRRTAGNVKVKLNKRKSEYVALTKKLRKHLAEIKKLGKISPEESKKIRNKIRNKEFRSKAHLRDYLGGIKHKNKK